MNEINLGSLKMPINAATKSFAILAKRGAGKTYLGGVMAEEFFKNGVPFVVFDPIDVWWGLRVSADGKGAGLPIVVFGLRHQDIELDREMGREIARAVVQENVSCVISTFGMPKVAMRHLVAEFAEELLHINNTPRHVFIEEAHEYVPQRISPGAGKTFAAVESLVTMGRNQGIGVTMLNQRAATLNKDVLTQIDTLLALRSVGPQDRDALRAWVEEQEAEGDFNKFMSSLATLKTGTGWVWSPEFLGVFEQFKIRKRETFHPDREKIGSTFVMPNLDQVDVQSFISKFKTHIEAPKEKKGKTNVLGKHNIDAAQKQLATPLFSPPVKDYEREMRELKNQHESEMITANNEIRRLSSIIANVSRAIESQTGGESFSKTVSTSAVSMWVSKLGNGGPSKILEFLAARPSDGFTRQQIALAIGASYSSVKGVWIPLLKRNLLIKESGEKLTINPDL